MLDAARYFRSQLFWSISGSSFGEGWIFFAKHLEPVPLILVEKHKKYKK
jgi:hypothetical protein